jgi:hypothetical protein
MEPHHFDGAGSGSGSSSELDVYIDRFLKNVPNCTTIYLNLQQFFKFIKKYISCDNFCIKKLATDFFPEPDRMMRLRNTVFNI